MKIAHVCPFFKPTICGVGQAVYELAIRQIKEGHEVHVFTSDYDKFKRIKKEEENLENINTHRCFHLFKVTNFTTFWPSLLWKLPKRDLDVIHTHNFGHPHVFLATLIGKIKGVKIVHTTHCPWASENRSWIIKVLMWLNYNTLGRLTFKWTDKIIAITPWEIDFIKKYGGAEKKIVVLPNGVDSLFFKKQKGNYLKQKLKIEGKIVLFLGRFNITKGPDKLILAAKDILKERKDIYFVFIGPDEGMKSEMLDLSKGEKNIFILDAVRNKQEIIKVYQSADLYVLPSSREGLPLTLFEAMASGLPIVASPVNGIPYKMKENLNGLFVDYGDIKNLEKSILKIIDNKKLADKFRRNNIKKARNYNWDRISKETLKVYEI